MQTQLQRTLAALAVILICASTLPSSAAAKPAGDITPDEALSIYPLSANGKKICVRHGKRIRVHRARTTDQHVILGRRLTSNARQIKRCRSGFRALDRAPKKMRGAQPCADLNNDGSVSSTDISLMLARFLARDMDFNGDGVTNSFDISAFLVAYSHPEWCSAPTPTPDDAPAECRDGIDNDGNGLIDMNDPGCVGPNYRETATPNGFTYFTPSADTRIVYVSSSSGSDSNSGLSPDAPKRTILAGYALMRNGYPDWLLLKRGDVFTEQIGRQTYPSWEKSGRSPTEKMLISSYGAEPTRPQIRTGEVAFGAWNRSNIAVVGLDLYAEPCDPNSPNFRNGGCETGISLLYANRHILIEDNRVRYFGLGLLVQSVTDSNGVHNHDHIDIRRNVITHNYNTYAHSQGIYAWGPGRLDLEENFFYHNGWNADFRFLVSPTPFGQSGLSGITNGRLRLRVNNATHDIAGINLSGVTSYADVAQRLSNRIAQVVPSANVSVQWTGEVLVFRASTPSNANYGIEQYGGSTTGTDIHAILLGSSGTKKHPSATIFNRNMYLSGGYANTATRRNITVMGASGGIQQRMGGISENNLFLREPIAVTFGHSQNPDDDNTTGSISYNVVLDSGDISDAPRGMGVSVSNGEEVSLFRNIVAHNQRGTGNIEGIFFGTDNGGPDRYARNVTVRENVVYKWQHPTSHSGDALASRRYALENIVVENNYFQQTLRGKLVRLDFASVLPEFRFRGNTYFATSAAAPHFRSGNSNYSFGQWQQTTGETGSFQTASFPDPERSIETYLQTIKEPGEFSRMIALLDQQSRFTWRDSLTASAINNYIRDGFGVPNP